MDRINYTSMLENLREFYRTEFLDKLDFKEGDFIQADFYDHGVLLCRKRMKISWMNITHLSESVTFQITGHKITTAGHMKKDYQSEFVHIDIDPENQNGRVIRSYTDYIITVLSEAEALTKYSKK